MTAVERTPREIHTYIRLVSTESFFFFKFLKEVAFEERQLLTQLNFREKERALSN